MKIILLGDSITQGLGSKKVNFTEELIKLMGEDTEIINLALTGSTIKYGIELLSKIEKEHPDVVIILYGNVDAQIRPARGGKIYKHLPKRYQLNNGSMLSPRPFYSRKFFKRTIQKVDNFFRTIFRKLVFIVDGYEQWISLSEFTDEYDCLLCSLSSLASKVICCSTVYIDDNLFPKSIDQYIKYNDSISALSQKYKSSYLDLFSYFKNLVTIKGWEEIYNADHFHPNGTGYKYMAKLLVNQIRGENENVNR